MTDKKADKIARDATEGFLKMFNAKTDNPSGCCCSNCKYYEMIPDKICRKRTETDGVERHSSPDFYCKNYQRG